MPTTRPDFRGTQAEHFRAQARIHLDAAAERLADLAVLVRDPGDVEAVADAHHALADCRRCVDDIGAEVPPDDAPETRCCGCGAPLAFASPGSRCLWCDLSERHLV